MRGGGGRRGAGGGGGGGRRRRSRKENTHTKQNVPNYLKGHADLIFAGVDMDS